jgi:adenylate kinase
MFVILLGPPGAGKGTQADLLAARLQVPKISTGDLFRDQISRGTPLGVEVARFINAGQLVPDATTLRVLEERLGRPDAHDGAVFDGFPRTIPQAEALDALLAGVGRQVDRVIDVSVPTEEIVQRVAGRLICRNCHATYHELFAPSKVAGICDRCGRAELYRRPDDQPDAIRTRLRVYAEQTEPLIDYFARHHVLVAVDGAKPREQVTRALLAALDGQAAKGA